MSRRRRDSAEEERDDVAAGAACATADEEALPGFSALVCGRVAGFGGAVVDTDFFERDLGPATVHEASLFAGGLIALLCSSAAEDALAAAGAAADAAGEGATGKEGKSFF